MARRDPATARRGAILTPPADRIRESMVVSPETGCWEWQRGRDTNGYGRICIANISYMAHRIAYEEFVGEIPSGLCLDHLCRVRHCVNPAHLEPVTLAENNYRGISPVAVNRNKTHCKRGHAFSEENTRRSADGHRTCITCAKLPKAARK